MRGDVIMLYATLFSFGLFLSIVPGSITMGENKKAVLTKCFNSGLLIIFFGLVLWRMLVLVPTSSKTIWLLIGSGFAIGFLLSCLLIWFSRLDNKETGDK